MDWQPGTGLTEREIVHLADKLVRGSRIVPVQARFAEKLALYEHDTQAVAAIEHRRRVAEQLAAAVESALGRPLDDLLATAEGPWTT